MFQMFRVSFSLCRWRTSRVTWGAIHGLKGNTLDLILHSPGGSFEAADQIVTYLRSKFSHIRAIVPQNAMSAATMIACACDEIVMGKQSAIGPIDPQVTLPSKHGHFTTPADAILRDFERAKAEIKADPKSAALWVKLLEALPHGVLTQCENVIELSKQRVEAWLRDYMKLDPTAAKDAAAWLGDANHHKTHGRPINLHLARERGLKVTELEPDQAFQDAVLSVYHATMITFESTTCVKMIENHQGKGAYVILAQK